MARRRAAIVPRGSGLQAHADVDDSGQQRRELVRVHDLVLGPHQDSQRPAGADGAAQVRGVVAVGLVRPEGQPDALVDGA